MRPSSGVGLHSFLSTPSARRATLAVGQISGRACISIHALREEGDQHRFAAARPCTPFLSTPSARRATSYLSQKSLYISYFYPRPPRGGRRGFRGYCPMGNTFLSTPSARRATFDKNGGRNTGYAFLSTPSARRATAKTERKPSAFVSLYTSLHKLQRGAFKTNRKITPLLAQTAVIPVRSVPENHVHCLFALAGYHPDIKRAAHYPVQTPGAVQRARPWSGNCCPAGRTADCPRQGRSGRSALP